MPLAVDSSDTRTIPRILFVTPDLGSNSLGRTYALWLLTEHLGWPSRIVSMRGEQVWGPLDGSPFAASCTLVETEGELAHAAQVCDLLVAVKPVLGSFDVAFRIAGSLGKPILLDIDDPDLEALFDRPPLRRVVREVLKPRKMAALRKMRSQSSRVEHIVSNPVLQSRHGGTIVPHARVDEGAGSPHSSSAPRVVFVGTARQHKGIEVLRVAVAELADEGFTLLVTDDPPSDARPWESWIGRTSIEVGARHVREADIIPIPSTPSTFTEGQLPAKLVDAMIAGRAVVASDVGPIPWALGGTGTLFRPGDVESLRNALLQCREPATRAAAGDAARARALELFAVPHVAQEFSRACYAAIGRGAP